MLIPVQLTTLLLEEQVPVLVLISTISSCGSILSCSCIVRRASLLLKIESANDNVSPGAASVREADFAIRNGASGNVVDVAVGVPAPVVAVGVFVGGSVFVGVPGPVVAVGVGVFVGVPAPVVAVGVGVFVGVPAPVVAVGVFVGGVVVAVGVSGIGVFVARGASGASGVGGSGVTVGGSGVSVGASVGDSGVAVGGSGISVGASVASGSDVLAGTSVFASGSAVGASCWRCAAGTAPGFTQRYASV
jgi:hypothetical protein